MNRAIYVFVILSILICSCKNKEQPKPEILTGSWKQVASFPGAYRSEAFAFSIGNKGYLIGGYFGSTYFSDFWEYDPSTNKWTQKADYPGNGHFFKGFEINNKGYLYSGFSPDTANAAQPLNEFYEYDPSTDKWTKKANFDGKVREGAVAFSINGQGFLGLGAVPVTNNNPSALFELLKDFWSYNPGTDKWARIADYPGNSYLAIGFACNGKGYAGLGSTEGVFDNEFWQYNPDINTWTLKEKIYYGNWNGGQFVIGSKAYAGIGGDNNDPQYNNGGWVSIFYKYVMEYNPQTDQWTKKTDFPAKERYNLVCFSINNMGYAGLGNSLDISHPENETNTLQFWQFTP